MSQHSPISAALPERLSVQLKRIALRCNTETITVRELIATLKGSPYLLLIALMSLPFLIPVSIPGISIPAGVIITLFGLRLTIGQKPIVPKRLQDVKLPQKVFPSILKGASKILRAIEVFSRPRWLWMSERGLLNNIYGLVIVVSALLLMLPLPIPFANFFPALTLLLLSLGLIERDGVLIVSGIIAFLLTIAFFVFLVWGGKEIADHLLQGIN